MLIARIVSSNSHVDYVARVLDEFDSSSAPSPEDHGFGRFVSVPSAGTGAVGVIYNSLIVNPEYASFGPRLSPKPELGSFSPDYLNEQGVLVGILLLGTLSDSGKASHELPTVPLSAGDPVEQLSDEEFLAFHRDEEGRIVLKYYSQVISQAGSFAVPLLDSIVARLTDAAGPDDLKRLEVLRQNLSWQRTVGNARL